MFKTFFVNYTSSNDESINFIKSSIKRNHPIAHVILQFGEFFLICCFGVINLGYFCFKIAVKKILNAEKLKKF